MQSWANDLIRLPIAISFAGLVGTTQDMIRGGWEFTMMVNDDPYHYGKRFSFYGHHKALNLKCISGTLFAGDRVEIEHYVLNARMPVAIDHVAQAISISAETFPIIMQPRWDGVVGLPHEMFQNRYDSIHPERMTVARRMIEHVGKFSSVDDGTEILVPKTELWTIEKHLDEIRRIQEPLQKEIRQRMLAEKDRESRNVEPKTKIYLVS